MDDYQRWLKGVDDNPSGSRFLRQVGPFTFVPLVNEKVDLIAELDIALLRPEAPGSILTQGGDIDNRLKTLFDALRMFQQESELRKEDSPKKDEELFYCLLEDDNLIERVCVETGRLLEPVSGQLDVLLIVEVTTKVTRATLDNLGLGV